MSGTQTWSLGTADDDFASLQNSSLGSSSSSSSTDAFEPTSVPEIGSIKLPSWMSTDPDQNLGELLKAYKGIGKAFDPMKQVNKRKNLIAYNTSAGGQAANNAATEYANRAAQSGASALGAGVVKAQSMMPVMAQNASLKTEAADLAAKSHQEAISLAATIGSTIAGLRQDHLKSLTNYAAGQQGMFLQNSQFNRGLQEDRYKTDSNLELQERQLAMQNEEQKRLAAQGLLAAEGPSGRYTTDATGNVTSGNEFYNSLNDWKNSRTNALATLGGML